MRPICRCAQIIATRTPASRASAKLIRVNSSVTPRLARIVLHPIKSLDPLQLLAAKIGPAGALEIDRAWALYSAESRLVNADRNPAMHRIRAKFVPDLSRVTLSAPGDPRDLPPGHFEFPADTEPAAEWFGAFLDEKIIVRYSSEGFPDDAIAGGPTIISTASLQAVCEWFPDLDMEQARRRFRTNLEIDGVPPFWEDRLFGPNENYAVRFRIGDVQFEGAHPCERCVVPARNPQTGADQVGFQKRLSELRRRQLPPWAAPERFEHFYYLATNTRVASSEAGKILRVGDSLSFA
jgi:uncharacterized protein YcbX